MYKYVVPLYFYLFSVQVVVQSTNMAYADRRKLFSTKYTQLYAGAMLTWGFVLNTVGTYTCNLMVGLTIMLLLLLFNFAVKTSQTEEYTQI